ncbi:hypothetical protein EHS11_02745 [Leptospira ilyithenensis]|uniref:M23ase beta-sheet core domain-containing protein n=2 Tax=Leptospira ilyithenensis TaxID=2484901 RepID=A0A4R9LWW7_9LEPT|nr:hypothetical protein EHS11_02745 [Leptospira ilyithenensis]
MGAIGGAMASIGTFVGASASVAANVGAAIVNGAVQAIDGSRNGTQGIIAGLANGALGVFSAGGALDLSRVTSSLTTTLTPVLKNTALGLGVSYDKQAGWGGRIGIGSATTNASISFSQRGNTTISGSANIPGVKGLQGTLSTTTNGATTVGANYNAGNGPREGWNVGANYDINGGGFSGSVGYTDPNSGLGLTSTVDGNGLSTSAQLNGVNLATNGPDGFNMDEINWSEQNINLAQDRGNKLQQNALLKANGISDPDSLSPTERNRILGEINSAAEYKQLRESGKTDAEIAAMSRDQREAELDRINGEVNPDTLAIAALASVGTFFGGALAFMGLGGGTGNGSTPPVRGQVVDVPARRREDGDDDDVDMYDQLDHTDRLPQEVQDQISSIELDSSGNKVVKLKDGRVVTFGKDGTATLYTSSNVDHTLILTEANMGIPGVLGLGGVNALDQIGLPTQGKVERYPLDPKEIAKPVSITKEQYKLTDQGKEDVKSLRENASKVDTKVKDSDITAFNERQAIKREAIEKPLKDLQTEIQNLRNKIETNGQSADYDSSVDKSVLNDLQKQEKALSKSTSTKLTQLSKQEVTDRKNLPEAVRLQSLDNTLSNPYRSQVDDLSTQLAALDPKSAEYLRLNEEYEAVKINSSAFDNARDTLLNPKVKETSAALAAEMLNKLNPDVPVSRPEQSTVLENKPNREHLTPGYDPSGRAGGILPGINHPDARVTDTPLEHSSRGKNKAYHATDIALPYGTPYMPVAEGTAEVVRSSTYGNQVKIKHGNGVETSYAHNSEVLVTNGQHVTSSTVIANVGNTGNVDSSRPTQAPWYGGSHIHYELKINNQLVPSQNFDWNRFKTEGQTYVDDYVKRYGKDSPGYYLVEKKK